MFIFYYFIKTGSQGVYTAAKKTAELLGKDENTVRTWKAQFEQGNGCLSVSTKGIYARDCLITMQKLKMKAIKWERENGFTQGKHNCS